MAGIRIATITYDHRPIEFSTSKKALTVGQQVDAFISETISSGSLLVSEVSVFFETPEEQYKLQEAYSSATEA